MLGCWNARLARTLTSVWLGAVYNDGAPKMNEGFVNRKAHAVTGP